MQDTNERPRNVIPRYLTEKRRELIWALSEQQEYRPTDIMRIFNFRNVSSIMRILEKKPDGWKSPWIKKPY